MKRFIKGQVEVLTKEKITDDNWETFVVPKLKSIIDYCDNNKLAIRVAFSNKNQIFFDFDFVAPSRELCRLHLRTVKGMFKEQFKCKTSDVMILQGDKLW